MAKSKTIFVTVTKQVDPKKQEEWLSMAKDLSVETWKEDGCLLYQFVRSKENDNRFVIVEAWSEDQCLQAHFNTPHFQKLVPAMDAISETVELDVSQPCLSFSQEMANPSYPLPESVFVTVTKQVAPENQKAWLVKAEELSVETWKEDGCLMYQFVCSKENENRFVIAEEWASQKHLEAHFTTSHFQKLVPEMDAISETVELDVSRPCLTVARTAPGADVVTDRKRRNGRILIVYDSSTGSTACIADLIAEGAKLLDRMDVRVRVVPGPPTSWEKPDVKRDALHPFATHADVYWADAVAAGTPTNLGGISYRMKQFWDDFSQCGGWGSTDGKIGTAFTSQGSHGGGGELTCQAMMAVLMNFGFSVFGITDYVSFLDSMHYGSIIAKKPRDEVDKMKCRRQGLRLAEMVAYYINGRDEANPMVTKKWEEARWGFPGIPPKKADIEELSLRNQLPHISLLQGDKQASVTHKTSDYLIPKPKKALVFTKMDDYLHDSTPAMAAWVHMKLHELGWQAVVADDSSFIDEKAKLDQFDAVVFLNNSGQIFKETENLMAHVQAGKAVVGVHAAIASFLNGKDASGETIMKPTTDIFETIFGSHFENHPPIQTGTIKMSPESNELSNNLTSIPAHFTQTDEFFNFTKNVSDDPDFTVVAWADETTYEGGRMGEKHPIAWYREMGENKAPIFYSALGHSSDFYNGTAAHDHVATLLEAGLRFCCK